jgi:flagellar export protein FliJ
VQLHEAREREARRQVGVLEQQRQGVQNRIDGLIADRLAAAQATSIQDRMQLSRYWQHIDGQMVAAEKIVSQLQVEIDKARQHLNEAHRTFAIFKQLQEQDAAQERRRVERQEGRRLEEFAALQYIKRREVPQ